MFGGRFIRGALVVATLHFYHQPYITINETITFYSAVFYRVVYGNVGLCRVCRVFVQLCVPKKTFFFYMLMFEKHQKTLHTLHSP